MEFKTIENAISTETNVKKKQKIDRKNSKRVLPVEGRKAQDHNTIKDAVFYRGECTPLEFS